MCSTKITSRADEGAESEYNFDRKKITAQAAS